MAIEINKVFQTIEDNDFELFRGYLNQGVNINAISSTYGDMSLLNRAAWKGRDKFVKELIDRNARIDLNSNNGYTNLYYALRGDKPGAVTKMMIDAGANPYDTNPNGLDAFGIYKNFACSLAAKEALYNTTLKPGEKYNPEPPKPPEDTSLSVIFNRSAGSHDIEEVYLFESKERITYYHKPGTKALECATREAFADITGHQALRQAFEEHQKRGGKMTEEDVFVSALPGLSFDWKK